MKTLLSCEFNVDTGYVELRYANEVEAVAQAKKIYSDADGCAICCPDAHRG